MTEDNHVLDWLRHFDGILALKDWRREYKKFKDGFIVCYSKDDESLEIAYRKIVKRRPKCL